MTRNESTLVVDSVPVETIPLQALEEYYAIFQMIDEDCSGEVSPEELRDAFRKMHLRVPQEDLLKMLRAMDADNSGEIDFQEFASVLHGVIVARSDVCPANTYAVFGNSNQAELTEFERIQGQIWGLMDDPTSSRLAMVIAITIVILIAASTITFIAETFPTISTDPEAMRVLQTIETIAVSAFTLELLIRFFSSPTQLFFFVDPLNLVDLFAILPFYIELILAASNNSGTGGAILRTIRLVRVFRLMKVSRYLTWLNVFSSTISASMAPLGMIFFITIVALILFSSMEYYLEHVVAGSDDPEFESILSSFWWGIQTMTTVGYGDAVPASGGGKAIAAITSLGGVLILAIPISIISSNYNYEVRKVEHSSRVLMQEEELLEMAEKNRKTTDEENSLHWTQPFLRTALSAIVSNRSRLMSSIKQGELRTRDNLIAEGREFVESLDGDPRAKEAVRG